MKQTFEQFSIIVQNVGFDLGIVVRGQDVVASSDKDTRQIANAVIATCEDLLFRYPWKHSIGTDPWVMKADGSFTYKLISDTDTPMMDARIIKQGASWRYLSSKGFTYAEPFRGYEKRINEAAFDYNGNVVVDTNVRTIT